MRNWCGRRGGRRRARAGFEARAWLRYPWSAAGPGRGAGGWRQGQGGPRDRPLRAFRLACGDLAGGPPPTGTPSDLAHRSGRHNKTARPQWGRAVLLCRRGVRGLLVTPLVGRAALCARGRRPARSALFVAPLVFRAPEGPAVGPGCLVCPWAAARPRAVRAASFARRVASKPGQAPPPPTGPAAAHGPRSLAPQPSGPVGTLHTGGACVAVTSPARPYRMGTAAWVSGLSTQWRPVADADWCVGSKRARALRALRRPPHRRRLCRCVWLGASPRSPARPRRRPRAPQPTGSIAWPSRSCGALHAGRANPLRVAVRSRFEVVSCPKCRPPRRKTLKTGCYGRSGLRFGRIGTCHSALLAREPAIASGNPLCRT